MFTRNALKSLIIEFYYVLRRTVSIYIKGKKEYLVDYKISRETKNGINVFGFIDGAFGVGEAARCILKAIAKSNISFSIINIISKEHYVDVDNKCFDISNEMRYNINLFCVNAEQVPYLKMKYRGDVWKGKYNIAYWFWELPEFPDQWVRYTKYFDEIWVASDFVFKSISEKCEMTVKKIPLPMSLELDFKYDRQYYGLLENKFIFLFIYDELSSKTRKNPEAVIEAFEQAFSSSEKDVQLVIKVGNLNKNNVTREYYDKLQQKNKKITIISQNMSKKEINSLISNCDVYVSLHRSEGWGLTLAEAMFCGKPVIATNWSGNTDFMNKENSCLVDYELKTIKEEEGPYQVNQLWAYPNTLQASEYMKKLYTDVDYYKLIAGNAIKTIQNDFSTEQIAKIIEKRIGEIVLKNRVEREKELDK